jgi:HSP20 family protein
MERLFGQLPNTPRGTSGAGAFPALNVWEDDDAYHVSSELPGLELEDLEILVNGGKQLTIKGERKEPQVDDATWHRRERGFGSFARAVDLPGLVDSERVQARFHNGVLTVDLPKAEQAKPRRITVQGS